MREIELTQGKVTQVDNEDYEWLNQWKWIAWKNGRSFYAVRHKRYNGKQTNSLIHMHREILNTPYDKISDHKDGYGLNNQRYNLRICTKRQNGQNQKPQKDCTSKFKGVSWFKRHQKWYAYICLPDRKKKHLGYYPSEILAAKAYNDAAKRLFGDFACLNPV